MAEPLAFPSDKMDAAVRYLKTVRPWWSRFVNHLVVVPVDSEPLPGMGSTMMMQTDQDMRLYVDVGFVRSQPLHVVAGAVEHEVLRHVKGAWGRLRWLEPEDRDKWAGIALELEIGSTIESANEGLTMDQVRTRCSRSVVFRTSELNRWEVTSPPSVIDAGGWHPDQLGLEPGLAAEQYVKLLMDSADAEDQDEDDSESQEDSDEPEDEGKSDPEDQGQDEEQGGSDEQEGSQSDASDESQHEQSDPGRSEDQDQDEDQDEDASDESQHEQSDGEGDGEDASREPEQGDKADDGPINEGSGQTADQDGEGSEGDSQDERPGEAEPDQESRDSDEGMPGADQSPSDLAQERMSDPQAQMWAASSTSDPDDPETPVWMPDDEDNEDPATEGEVERALQELEQDVMQHQRELPDDQFTEWAARRRRARKVDWQSKLRRILVSANQSVKMQGASDLSYSVRNPNQQLYGPILQGMHSYTPTVYNIMDVSHSMLANDRMFTGIQLFEQLTRSVLSSYGARTTWITASVGVVDVGSSATLDRETVRKMSRGFGGTDLGETVRQVMEGTFRWKGRRYPKPDLLTIVTDCEWRWPNTRPARDVKLVVCSVGTPGMTSRYVPVWLDQKQELVVVD